MRNEIQTSTGEIISQGEFQRRRSHSEYCVDCGAKIIPAPFRDRCSTCSSNFARGYYEGEKYSGMSGLMGGE